MCGRFFVDAKNREIDRLVDALGPDNFTVKLGNIYPGDTALALTLEKGRIMPEAMTWGFPRWDGKGLIFNARSETALDKPMFSRALRQHPAIIPASAFYEWQPEPDRKRKQKYLISGEKPLLYMAAFWNFFASPDNEPNKHFTILTTEANASMRSVHSRMPLLLTREKIDSWLQGSSLQTALDSGPYPVHVERDDTP